MSHLNLSYNEIMHFVDLTCLKDQVALSDILSLASQAEKYQVAALCVWPLHLDWIPLECTRKKATVVNFPQGNEPVTHVQKAIDQILRKHPGTEIDYVFSYQDYWAGNQKKALEHCHTISKHCAEHKVMFKVILETGVVEDPLAIRELAKKVIEQNVDMLKTSTGKTPIGATKKAVEALCLAIKDAPYSCGLKVSGGIKTFSQALEYFELITDILPTTPSHSWLRFGCSQLIHDEQN